MKLQASEFIYENKISFKSLYRRL